MHVCAVVLLLKSRGLMSYSLVDWYIYMKGFKSRRLAFDEVGVDHAFGEVPGTVLLMRSAWTVLLMRSAWTII